MFQDSYDVLCIMRDKDGEWVMDRVSEDNWNEAHETAEEMREGLWDVGPDGNHWWVELEKQPA